MARWFRCLRCCRLRAPSKISSRNRNVAYVVIFLPMILTFLLIPGGEIANYKYSGPTDSHVYISTFDTPSEDLKRQTRSVERKLILLWNGFFESPTWRVKGNPFEGCAEKDCELSRDKSRVSQADAVLFDATGLYKNPHTPEEHPPWQVWILHNSEPPYNIHLDLPKFNNVFNWTSWYRTDADIFAPYGLYVDKNADEDTGDYEEVNDTNKVDGDEEKKETKDQGEQKQNNGTTTPGPGQDVYPLHDRVLFFAASNCQDRGRRYKRVAQLKNFLPIDMFGDCGQYQCPKFTAKCDAIFAKYQFVLAFENGYCRDYITEKLWNAYRRLQIPIVSGGADYKKFAIPGSYIDYDNFSSVEALANHVHRVSTDPGLYNSYFSWRQRYEAVTAPVTDWCQICQSLHDRNRTPQVYKNLVGWVAQDSCPLYSKYQHFWTQLYLGLFKVFGV